MLIVELNDRNLLNISTDAFLVGIKKYSSECYKHFELAEVVEIISDIKKLNKKVFIDLTNVFHDADLECLKKDLEKIQDADGFFFFDLGVMSLIEKEKRVYFAPTYLTNQFDINIALEENKYVLVSPEISLKELNNIKFSESLILVAFGTWEIFHSRRPLISNYFNYRNKEYKSDSKYQVIEEFRNDLYPIIENNGTKIYLNGYYYLGEELKGKNTSLLIKSFDLEKDIVTKIVDAYNNYLNDGEDIEANLKKLEIDLNKGLLYEESILKKGGANE